MPLVVRKQRPPAATDYRKYKPFLRIDFEYRCAYCHIPEIRNGPIRNYAADHFKPKSRPEFAHLKSEYTNLYYVCHSCNDFKGRTWPEPAQEQNGDRFLDPCQDDFGHHFAIGSDGGVRAFTTAAEYTNGHLNLNREFLRVWRSGKVVLATNIDDLRRELTEIEQAPEEILQLDTAKKTVQALKRALTEFEKRLEDEFGDWWR